MQIQNRPSLPAPKFGREASAKEIEFIREQATKAGVDGKKINPLYTQILEASRIPVWNFFKQLFQALPIATNRGTWQNWINSVNANEVPSPYSANLLNFPTKRRTQKALAQTDTEKRAKMEKLYKQITGSDVLSPKQQADLDAQFAIKDIKIQTGPRQILHIMIPPTNQPKTDEAAPTEQGTPN